MREILFKGKTKQGEWVYWNELGVINFDLTDTEIALYVKDLNDELTFDTIGQFTGLTDKSGKKIFEGDIAKVTYIEKREYMGVKYDDEYDLIEQVCYSTEKACYMLCIKYDDITMFRPIHNFENLVTIKSLEVIGNIHDNPELLEVQNER